MSVQQIEQVFWYERYGSMVVTYGDGKPDRAVVTESAAAALAEDARLVLVPTLPGVVRWVRQ
jgi:hypothetical protein